MNTNGYNPVLVAKDAPWYDESNRVSFDIRDANHNGAVDGNGRLGYLSGESFIYDRDSDTFISDDERDEDADGLTNVDELRGRMTPGYWKSCYGTVGRSSTPSSTRARTSPTATATATASRRRGRPGPRRHPEPDGAAAATLASGEVDWDAHDGLCVIDSNISLTGPDGPDADDEPDPLEELPPERVRPGQPVQPVPPVRLVAHLRPGRRVRTPASRPSTQSTNWFALQ